MKHLPAFLRPLFALALVVANAPAWACQSSCRSQQELACVRLCAHSSALLTHNGKYAGLSSGSCTVRSQISTAATVLAEKAALPAPSVDFMGLAPASPAALAAPLTLALAGRGPPSPSQFLDHQHAFSTAPPTFL